MNQYYAQNNLWQNQNAQSPYSRYSRISIEDAMTIAIEQIPGEVVKVELDTKNGLLVYEVDITTMEGLKYEVEIDAQSGAIIKMKRD